MDQTAQPTFDRYRVMSGKILAMIDNASFLASEAKSRNQKAMYFDGYQHGLEYALAVISETAKEEDLHGNP